MGRQLQGFEKKSLQLGSSVLLTNSMEKNQPTIREQTATHLPIESLALNYQFFEFFKLGRRFSKSNPTKFKKQNF
jgi:hypothetical protein